MLKGSSPVGRCPVEVIERHAVSAFYLEPLHIFVVNLSLLPAYDRRAPNGQRGCVDPQFTIPVAASAGFQFDTIAVWLFRARSCAFSLIATTM